MLEPANSLSTNFYCVWDTTGAGGTTVQECDATMFPAFSIAGNKTNGFCPGSPVG